MESSISSSVMGSVEHIANMQLPRWRDLPDLEIYMDQVLSLISRYFENYPGFDSRGLTSSMVNNYVKLGVIPPPVKKKYARSHLACLIIICILKSVLPISLVSRMIMEKIECGSSYESLYDSFCDLFECSVSSAAGIPGDNPADLTDEAFRAALNAHAEQTFATALMRAG